MAILAGVNHYWGLSFAKTKAALASNEQVKDEDEPKIKEVILDSLGNEEEISDTEEELEEDDSPTVETTKEDTSNDILAYSKVWSYPDCFPDSNAVQLEAAEKNGVHPMKTREAVYKNVKKGKLTNISSSPFYVLDDLTYSMPFLVPKAQILLNTIGINFLDSLDSKGFDLYLPVVTSVLRATDDVKDLQRRNRNSTKNSCHCYGTTVDITYNRFMPLNGGEPVRYDERLKKVLAEVLFDLHKSHKCYIKYEKQQACFHLTVI